MSKDFMLGCNYWDSESGTEMWKRWNKEVVESDLKTLSECGVEYLRVFPMWRDFQPLKKLYSYCNGFGEYVIGENEKPLYENGDAIDEVMIDRFRTFADIAKKYNMKLIVSIVTGWMSARMFVPPALDGKNLLTDPESLMWMGKFIRGFVSRVKDIDNIAMWDLGNECNCMEKLSNRNEAYTWTMFCRNAIYAEDQTRKISSGMHSLSDCGIWRIDDQGDICDMLTTHPYPSPSIKTDIEPYNRIRATIVPTAQSEWYSALSGKPCCIQEQGTFASSLGNEEMEAQFMRVNLLSAWANNLKGYLWWCASEQINMEHAPYRWVTIERELGLMNADKKPKPVGYEMAKIKKVMENLPEIEDKKTDAVCITCKSNVIAAALGSYILAKQAGFNVTFADNSKILPKSKCYIVPSIEDWTYMKKKTHDTLVERVVNDGAVLVVSFNGGQYNEFEKIFGLRSLGYINATKSKTAKFDFGDISYKPVKEILCESIGAEVLAKNEDGNIVMAKNKLGKGYVYFIGFGVEEYAFSLTDGFNPEVNNPYYKIYEMFSKELRNGYFVKSQNPFVGITQSKCVGSDDYIVTAVNYSDKERIPDFVFDKNIKYEVLYGTADKIPPCDAVIIRIYRD